MPRSARLARICWEEYALSRRPCEVAVRAARAYFAGAPHPGANHTAVNYHQAVPVVVTGLERITADPAGAAGRVWRRLEDDVDLAA